MWNKSTLLAAAFVMASALSGCSNEPKTPIEALKSDKPTEKYSVDFYKKLHEADKPQYDQLLIYCASNQYKPNCKNLEHAAADIFNQDPPLKLSWNQNKAK